MSLTPGQKLGPYEILSILGKGGMGEVYLARDPRLGRQVALKVLPRERLEDPERRKRFLHEARAAAAVDHPNIVHIHDVQEQDDGLIYLVMQHVEGRTLREVLLSEKLPLDRALAIAAEICGALSAAHEKGIVHRDIKPDNIMLDAAGHARLVDFGLARALEPAPATGEASEVRTMTRITSEPGKVLGTAAYMSPEQARGRVVDARSDIFSLGVTLYEMVARRHPFAGKTSVDTVDSLLNKDPQPIGELVGGMPPEIDWVVGKMLAKSPEERHQSARELEADLRRLGKGSTSSGPAGPVAEPTGKKQRSLWLLGSIAALGAAAIFTLWLAREKMGPLPAETIAITSGDQAPAAGAEAPRAPAMQLAVLPFQNVRDDDRIDYLGFALADGLISKLSLLDDVTVRPSSFVQKYRNEPPADPKAVGEELGVGHLLTGSILAHEEELRITVQLVDLEKGEVEWQSSVNARLDNLLEVQDATVDTIIKGMNLGVSAEERQRLDRDRPRDEEAFEMYLRARALPETVQTNKEAVRLLKEVLALDDGFAPAWVELSSRQYRIALNREGGYVDYSEAEKSALKALELNPDLPVALASISVIYTELGRHEELYLLLRDWIRRFPYSGEGKFSLSYLFRYTGLLDEAARYAEEALVLEPGNPLFRSGANVMLFRGDHERAWDFLNLSPGSGFWHGVAPTVAWFQGDMQRARELSRKAVEHVEQVGSRRAQLYMRARHLHLQGRDPDAAPLLLELLEDPLPDPENHYQVSALLAAAGETDVAIEHIREVIEDGFYCYPFMKVDPRTEGIRTDPDFQAVMELARQRHGKFKAFVAANP